MASTVKCTNTMAENQLLDEYAERKRKLQELKALGIKPYPDRFVRTHSTLEAHVFAEKTAPRLLDEIVAAPNCKVKLCGRLVLMRPHGKLTFAHLQDHSGKIQIAFMQDFVGVEAYKLLKKIDIADFLGVTGEFFKTKHGELTLLVKEYVLLAKTLRPLPEKFHGLADTETKYRKRYLDLLTDPAAYGRFLFRSHLISLMRNFLDEHHFIEIETPILNTIPSGAAAKPFKTHHHTLDLDLTLRIAPETYLKRAIAGGFDRVYEFAKCFRNEGMDPSHLQEFTMLEYYSAYWNYEDNMDFTEKLIVDVLKKLQGDLKIHCRDRDGKEQTIDFNPPWPRLKFDEIIQNDCGIKILDFYGDADGLRSEMKRKKIFIEKIQTMGYGNLCDALYKKVSRPRLIQPAFVILHPVDTKPLARRNDDDPRLADTFQLLINSWEIINAYSELIDTLDQRERLMRQADLREHGDEEAMPMDEDFLQAIEHGMPPISGWGMGIDRFVALLTNQDNLKDVVLFPLLRPENN